MKITNQPLQGASLTSHKKAWDFVAAQYKGGTSLPSWGTRGELQNEDILGNLKNKRILEIGFGSGDSLAYLVKHGASQVMGIDFSNEQFKIASETLRKSFKHNPSKLKKVKLLLQSMDDPLPEGFFDCIIAIYSAGWSEQPHLLFQNIFKKLKPGGTFCFSWDHYISRIVEQSEHGIKIIKSYHEPMPLVRENWKGSNLVIETHQLRPSDWFKMLTQAGFIVDGFWEPKPNVNTLIKKIYSNNYAQNINELLPTCVVFRAKKP